MSKNQLRSKTNVDKVIAFSIAWQKDDLLRRGLGLEHLRDLLLQIARPIVRTGASLAYAGNWEEREDNFTYELIRLIASEQEDNQFESDEKKSIGILYNHTAWPHYLKISSTIEAQWINYCRIVRITQEMANIPAADIIRDTDANSDVMRRKFNSAIVLSAMRKMQMEGMKIEVTDAPPSPIPAVAARIVLGGKYKQYSGFAPGLFEESLLTMEHEKPLFILGGFGGAAHILAQKILNPSGPEAEKLTLAWHRHNNPELDEFLDATNNFSLPAGMRSAQEIFDGLEQRLVAAKSAPEVALKSGLNEAETRQLMSTADPYQAVKLIRLGLQNLGILD